MELNDEVVAAILEEAVDLYFKGWPLASALEEIAEAFGFEIEEVLEKIGGDA